MRDAYHNEDPFNQPTMALCEAKMNVRLREKEQLAEDGSGSWPFQAGAKLLDLHSQVDPKTLNGWKKECNIAHDFEEARDEDDLFSLDVKMKIE
jgi:hypothetical protein